MKLLRPFAAIRGTPAGQHSEQGRVLHLQFKPYPHSNSHAQSLP